MAKTNSYWFDIWRLIKKRLFKKKSKQGLGGEWSWRHTFLTKIDGIFRFVILLVETLEKTKPHPWKNRQNCATSLGTFNAKNKDPWKLHMVFFSNTLRNSTSFLINPWIFDMIFFQSLWKFHALSPPTCTLDLLENTQWIM